MKHITFPIVEQLGGRYRVAELLSERGLKRSPNAVRMWSSRRSIPGDAMRELIRIAEERGYTYSASDFEPVEKEAEAAA